MIVDAQDQAEVETQVERDAAGVWTNRVRLRAQRRVMWIRVASTDGRNQLPDGLAIFHAEVKRALTDPAEIAESEKCFYNSDTEAQLLTEQIRMADDEFSRHSSCNLLRLCFGVSEFELNLLNLAVAVEIDPLLRRAYAYMHDDATLLHATPWLTAQLFEHDHLECISPDLPIARWRIAQPLEAAANAWAPSAAWMADPYFILWLIGRGTVEPALGHAAQLAPADSRNPLCLYPEELRDMLDFVSAMSSEARKRDGRLAVEIHLVGPSGSGKRTLATQFTAALRTGLLCVDAEALLGSDVPAPLAAERIIRAMRMARLTGAIVYWANSDRVVPRVWQAADEHFVVMMFGSQVATPPRSGSHATRRTFHLPTLRRSQRIELWRRYTDQPSPLVISDCSLTADEVAKAACVAPAGMEAVVEVCQQSMRVPESELFSCLPCPFTWDDIVLPHNVREHLMELEQQVRLRWSVYEEWGFERLCPCGRGITALFSGASGTGKTMAAQVVARSLGMKLYRVDLAGVVNKYIGETEKRLKQVFDACERANVLLFFDEADALFGQRTQVKDAHDRFANIEIDYLLQRMEQFEGIAVLATNRKGDLDKAFLRRIRFLIDFQQPGPAERLALWHRALIAQSPSGDDLLDGIDWNLLANKLNMSGAAITAASLGAAFLARADGGRIGMSHILHAARREMNKQGQVVRPGDWER